jgi:hypothetical protein
MKWDGKLVGGGLSLAWTLEATVSDPTKRLEYVRNDGHFVVLQTQFDARATIDVTQRAQAHDGIVFGLSNILLKSSRFWTVHGTGNQADRFKRRPRSDLWDAPSTTAYPFPYSSAVKAITDGDPIRLAFEDNPFVAMPLYHDGMGLRAIGGTNDYYLLLLMFDGTDTELLCGVKWVVDYGAEVDARMGTVAIRNAPRMERVSPDLGFLNDVPQDKVANQPASHLEEQS